MKKAETWAYEALELGRRLADPALQALAYHELARLAHARDDFAAMRPRAEQASTHAREANLPHLTAESLNDLGLAVGMSMHPLAGIPHFHEAEPGGYQPSTFADPANSFHEKAILCRAAENTCFVATVNCASTGSPTTSAVVRPDGTLLCYQPYGKRGLLIADIDLAEATGLLAARCKSVQ